MTFNPSDYIRDRGFDDISNSAAAGDTRVENAILYGNANLLKAADEAKFLRDSAKATGSAMRFAGQQAGNASMFGGAMSGLSSLAFGAYKGGHFDGGGGGAEFGEIGTSGSDLADFGYTPAEDIAFNNGTGVSWSTP